LLAVLLVLTWTTSCRAQASSRKTSEPTIVDYFSRLPADVLETPARNWLPLSRVDLANGYIRCEGDGAQPAFVAVLFRFTDGRPLLALGQAELEAKPDLISLRFFEEKDGKMRAVARSIFPVSDDGHRFELPRQGRTILVRDLKRDTIQKKLAWTGDKFELVK
jgi:hypothetical protein